MKSTNPYQVIIDLKLEADYLSQESCVKLMKEFAKREMEEYKSQEEVKCDLCGDKGEYLETHPERYGMVTCNCKSLTKQPKKE